MDKCYVCGGWGYTWRYTACGRQRLFCWNHGPDWALTVILNARLVRMKETAFNSPELEDQNPVEVDGTA